MAEPGVRSLGSHRMLKWDAVKKRRRPIAGARTAVNIEEKAYIAYGLDDIYEYRIDTEEWMILPPCDVQGFSRTNVRGSLTTVGGWYTSDSHAQGAPDCFSWDGASRKWVPRYPPMSTAQLCASVATTADHVVAADKSLGKNVEVMAISTRQWSIVARLPVSSYVISTAVCNGTVYVADYDHLYYCSLDVLLKSAPAQEEVWYTIDGPQSYTIFGLATVTDTLLWLGQLPQESAGLGRMIGVFLYDEETEAEEAFSELEAPFEKLCGFDFRVTALAEEKVLVLTENETLIGELQHSVSEGNKGSFWPELLLSLKPLWVSFP